MSNNSALAHLTATYTDSEGEEDHNDIADVEMFDLSAKQVPDSRVSSRAPSPTQVAPASQEPTPAKKNALRLVSYHDDTFVSDDEDVLQSSMLLVKTSTVIVTTKEPEEQTEENISKEDDIHTKYSHYGFALPPEPKAKPNQDLIKKIQHLHEKMEKNNMDMNRVIQERKEFRNPSIYEKLIQFCDINEFGTNYPIEMYDPFQWGPESYYEELAKVQKNEMLKRQKERKSENDKIEQAALAARKVEEEAKKRKSKWDQPAPSVVKPTITALTASVTGTKGTVISAFGALPKKIG